MNVTLLPAGIPWSGNDDCQYLSTCLVNGSIALDAGSLGFHGTPDDQARVGHVLLTHSHLDHVASLPIFLENVYDLRDDKPPVVHASRRVLEVLQRDILNEHVWPDFVALSREVRPFLRLQPFEAGETCSIDGLRITAIPVNHVVPTIGFLLHDTAGTVAFIPDTGPTDEIWQQAARCPDLRAVIVETTFPDEMTWLAVASKHLTPALLRVELAKLGRPVPTYIMHIKARYRVAVREQLAGLKMPQIHILESGKRYTF